MLNVDKFFYEALIGYNGVVNAVGENIYNPARTIEQEEEDVLPYIIIAYEDGSASQGTKDNVLTYFDSAAVSVMVCAESRDALADLTEKVMTAIAIAFEKDDFYDEHDDWLFCITDCTPHAGGVMYDAMKPCCFQTLTFQCDTEIR